MKRERKKLTPAEVGLFESFDIARQVTSAFNTEFQLKFDAWLFDMSLTKADEDWLRSISITTNPSRG